MISCTLIGFLALLILNATVYGVGWLSYPWWFSVDHRPTRFDADLFPMGLITIFFAAVVSALVAFVGYLSYSLGCSIKGLL
jgi:hypothetical protein